MFWNIIVPPLEFSALINRKHEMFWNIKDKSKAIIMWRLTVNMKCFEMHIYLHEIKKLPQLTVNMKCFEIHL